MFGLSTKIFTLADWKDVASIVQSLATAVSFIVVGWWVIFRYRRQQENYPNIEFSADLNFVGTQGDWWIVEIVALIVNKGKVQHRMRDFEFDLNALYRDDPVQFSDKWQNQVDFPHHVLTNSFLPTRSEFFFYRSRRHRKVLAHYQSSA